VAPLPTQFEIGRRTFFDFGPPFDYYELLVVRPVTSGSSVQTIMLTPPGDACVQPAKIEASSSTLTESVAALLGTMNPCAIPEKSLNRELKRCKKCSLFSGVEVSMQVQCGPQSRVIPVLIRDRDIFDPRPDTPEHTSWTMQLLKRLDRALGPGVMDEPMFPIPGDQESASRDLNINVLRDIGAGNYDGLFRSSQQKLSELYRAAQIHPGTPSVKLVSSLPFQPEVFVHPDYPPLARAAHVEGTVVFKVKVNPDGSTTQFSFENGPRLLSGALEKAVGAWRFPTEAGNQEVEGAVEFKLNCISTVSKSTD